MAFQGFLGVLYIINAEPAQTETTIAKASVSENPPVAAAKPKLLAVMRGKSFK